MTNKFSTLLLLPLLWLTSCTVGPAYAPPCVDAPMSWKAPEVTGELESCCCVYGDNWWEIFGDETLNALEQQVLGNNYTLWMAYDEIKKSRALMEKTCSRRYPQLSVDPAYKNKGDLYESYSTLTIVRAHEQLFALPFNLSYELDLWGKLKSLCESSYNHFEGELEAYQAVMLTITADLATLYYQIRTQDAQIDLLKQTLESREKALKINRSRYNAEVNNYADVSRAGAEATRVSVRYQEALRKRQELENRLATMLGQPSSEFHFSHCPLQGLPPQVPAGIPSDVLKRRPDIAEAEREMASESALVRVAYASFFPSIDLTAAAGWLSPHFKYFLSSFSALWSYGANISQPLFDGGALRADLAYEMAAFEKASASYQEKVLIAFQEVENALSNIYFYKNEFNDMSQSVDWAKKTYQITSSRYSKGLTFYLDVVESEQVFLENQLLLNDLQGLEFVWTVQLIRALGGGWNVAVDECERGIEIGDVDE